MSKAKKIWVSRDREDCFNEVSIWIDKPHKFYGDYESDYGCIGHIGLQAAKKLFGCSALGMCKCFEIKEVKE